ncbi:oxysterol-binding protein-related protein 8 [Schistocerca nitens]|uniref:oxysterol-binding protein-related protein 8 n=1 Tax=Schistocerca cancellata TaxID=274614 RepID=UPI0021173B7B|nr:oxysterol-binding protein-related protein 8 [Schistocerca cancellata]XP_049782951.1 oxysterol-binding protein-related protein 8 [Schistocerca cancellata]XP_049805959.1 oxysterol-binding protein-related protein 8 [Schistocerca nitens]XP_049845731.1 oxysterol-binding protein-related protein 8 isoform X2 [Schistocerca gregaria]XP_049845732.1 oxysterol-binding protein-related protein 8 isoform X2 [Schistocerca gregaria]
MDMAEERKSRKGMSSPIPVPSGGSRQSYDLSSPGHLPDQGRVMTPPNSSGRASVGASIDQGRVMTPPNSSGRASVGASINVANWLDNSVSKSGESPASDKLQPLTRKESYKAQRKNYCREKKRVAKELLSSLKDPSVIVLADWLKVRGTLKSWTKLWCVLKPGLLLLYKSLKLKSSHWVGTILLNTCQVIERPSKKDGFCFKLFHPLEQSIWAPRGPHNETIGAVVQPLPTSYLIFRAPSQAAGKCWLDALELSLRCSSLLVRSSSACNRGSTDATTSHETQWSEADYERHFNDHDLDDLSQPDNVPEQLSLSDSDSEGSTGKRDEVGDLLDDPPETIYVHHEERPEEFGSAGEQVEELAEENKSLIWYLVKQVRPGMDLSKVVLPTFILEPRSFLDKLSDSYYHADILSQAVLEDDAFTRMKGVVKWYLSGLYKKPKGLKKPYNPILGETFRCYWEHPNSSRTFYIAEQISHHPPVSAFYVTNRRDGFCISASILAKSKFYGNSTSAILDGVAVLTFLPRGEDYSITIPYAHCKGILMGTLTMELGGKVTIECEKTGYRTEIEFKLKPFLGGAEQTNMISGQLKLGKETLATLDGYWDSSVFIKDRRTGEEQLLWKPTPEIKSKRLKRYTVPIEHQGECESENLWQHVTAAILRDDQVAATEEKTVLEEAQRAAAKERKIKGIEWIPKHFEQDIISGQWVYKHADLRPWDPRNDVLQYEYSYVIQTKTRHRTPMIRTASIVSVDPQNTLRQTESRSSVTVIKSSKHQLSTQVSPVDRNSGSSSPEFHSDSSHTERHKSSSCGSARVKESLAVMQSHLQEQHERLSRIQHNLEQLGKLQREQEKERQLNFNRQLYRAAVLLIVIQSFITIIFSYIVQWK